jgi:hypothetical protein
MEIKHGRCRKLLREGSPLALKFLAALNQGLTESLRSADRRLMRLIMRDGPS